jgi:hypothetical protein
MENYASYKYYLSESLKIIRGGKNCISCIALARLPIILNPHHIPARKVMQVKKIMATTMTSTTAPSQLGNVFMNAVSVSSIDIFPFSL